jgi:transposase-like protein
MDFLLTAKHDFGATQRFFRAMLKDEPLLSPNRIGTDGAYTFPSSIKTSADSGHLHRILLPKHLQQRIYVDNFQVK